MKEVHEVRWFAFYDALFEVYKSWKALVQFFKSKTKPSDEEKPLLTNLRDIHFLLTTHLLMDVLPSFTQLSLIFQKQDIDIPVVPVALDGALSAAEGAKDGKGFYQKQLATLLIKQDKRMTFKEETVDQRS